MQVSYRGRRLQVGSGAWLDIAVLRGPCAVRATNCTELSDFMRVSLRLWGFLLGFPFGGSFTRFELKPVLLGLTAFWHVLGSRIGFGVAFDVSSIAPYTSRLQNFANIL